MRLISCRLIEHLTQEVSKNNTTNVWLYSDPLFYVLTYGYNAQGTLSFHDFENTLNNQFPQCMSMFIYF